MDIGEEDITDWLRDAYIILKVQGELEVIAPILAIHAIIRQYRVLKKDTQAIKVFIDSIQHNDVGGNHQKIARQR